MDLTMPAPAPKRAQTLPTGFNDLLQHSAVASYPRETAPTESIQARSQPASRYGTPIPQSHHSQAFDASMSYQQRGIGGQLPGYHQQPVYPQQHDSPYGPIPETSQPYSTPATSPPTPSRGSDVKLTRSGPVGHKDFVAKVLAPRGGRIEKAASKKKKEKAKATKDMPVLDKPLSELTKDSSIVIADIEQYVHRSSEVRQREVESGKNPGRVKRPMNAFMLYRKAYQQRAKEWAAQHNHQVVSRVCGLSWPLEAEEVRQQFKAWADIERDNHQRAHPNYKFAPAKPHKPQKFDSKFEDGSDGSELEDYDWGRRSGSRMRSATHTPHDDREYIPSRSVYAATHPHPHQHQFAPIHGLGILHQNRPALSFNPGNVKTLLTATYEHREVPWEYDTHLRASQQRHLHHGMAGDLLMDKAPSPSTAFHQPHDGLPSHYDLGQFQAQGQGGDHHSAQAQAQSQQHQHHLQQLQQHHPHAPTHFEPRIDPSLMPHEDGLLEGSNFHLFDGGLGGAHQTWQSGQLTAGNESETHFHDFLGLDETLSLEHDQYLRGHDEWHVQPLPETGQLDTSWAETKAEPGGEKAII